MIITETERLFLRQFELSDAAALEQIFGDPDVMRFGPGAQGPEWMRSWLQNCLNGYRIFGFGPWAMVERNGGKMIGYCGLFHYAEIAGRAEIELGYRLARPYWGRGYATEAARAARDYAFGQLGLGRLIALIDPQNSTSLRVAQKVGMRYEAEVMLEGYDHPDLVFSIRNPSLGPAST